MFLGRGGPERCQPHSRGYHASGYERAQENTLDNGKIFAAIDEQIERLQEAKRLLAGCAR
jgi:hypothetical protein